MKHPKTTNYVWLKQYMKNFFDNFSAEHVEKVAASLISSNYVIMMIMNDKLFLCDKYLQKGPLSRSLTIVTSQHAEVEIDPGLLKQQSVALPLHHMK